MRTITVANMKGGTAKTTAAAFLAHAFLELAVGRVLGVDADPAQSLLRWADLGGWELPVVGLPSRDIHRRVPAVASGYDVVVIDTPPLDEQAGIVYSALRAADDVLVPVAASTMELDRLTPIMQALEEVSPLRETPSRVWVLLTRTVPNAASTAAARDVLTGAGYTVLGPQIPRRERYAQAFGTVPELVPGDPYTLVAEALLKGESGGVQ